MAQINPLQGYDLIVTLKFAEPKGDCHIYLHRGSFATASGTVYYRYGDSAKWKELTVKGDKTVAGGCDALSELTLPYREYDFNYQADLGLSEDKLGNLMNKAKKRSGE